MNSKISKCNCINDYQDKKYGDKMRVMNRTAKVAPSKHTYYRCTICLALKDIGS